jgi:N-acyl-D-amino-acid deacylase
MLDYLIINGSVLDGSGADAVRTSIGIQGDRISYLGKEAVPAANIIDAAGLTVAPGFIDTHTHSEFTLVADGRAEGKLSQGVTTEINGNCGLSAAPLFGEAVQRREADQKEYGIKERWATFDDYFAIMRSKGFGINFATLCGHGNIRASVMGYKDGPPSDSEMEQMKILLRDAIRQGALGLTTGLIYPPGVYSTSEEIAGLAKVFAAECPSGVYASHMRSEGEGLMESIEETLKIGRESALAVHISHIKTSGKENWHKIGRAIALIEEARASGMKVTCDRYPYIASSTDLDTVIPAWAHEGGVQEEMRRLRDPATRQKILAGLRSRNDDYWKGIYISFVMKPENKWMEGENISEIAEKRNSNPAETVIEITIQEEGRAGSIFFTMSESNLKRFLSLPYVMIGSDSSDRSFSGPTRMGKPHPRGFGSFPRFIGAYVRGQGIVTLPEAVRKMTSLPASTFGLTDRGLVKKDYYADLVIFDYEKISDEATFGDPFKPARGIEYVFVNGHPAVCKGLFSDTLKGRILT